MEVIAGNPGNWGRTHEFQEQHQARQTALPSFFDDKVFPDKEGIHRIQRMYGQNKITAVLP